MTTQLTLPSKALSRRFELPEAEVDSGSKLNIVEAASFRTHAFVVGNIGLLIPSGEVSEVSDALPMCRLPNTPEWLLGVANLRGNMVPVFDLGQLLGVEIADTPNSKLLVVGVKDKAIGIRIHSMPLRVMLDAESKLARIPPLPEALQPFVRAGYSTDRIWVDWDMEGFFKAAGDRI